MGIKEKFNEMKIEVRAFIDGEYCESEEGTFIVKKSSYDGSVLPQIVACGKKEVDKAVICANNAFENGVWRGKTLKEKKEILLKLADLMEEHKEELAILDAVETSRAYQNYYYDSIPKAIEAMRYFAEAVDKVYDKAMVPGDNQFGAVIREPLGTVGIITPWNDPMVVSVWKFVPALLMGNSVIIKPAEQSSLSIIRVAALALEAGVPKGVFNVLPGYGEVVGKEIALHNDVRGVFFTGSSSVGKKIIEYSGASNMKKVGLECGGKSAFIVSKNCKDIGYAASVLAKNVFYNQGQICSAPSRAIVDKTISGEFLAALKKESENYIPGNPYNIENKVGCIVSREQYDKICDYIRIAGEEAKEVYKAPRKNEMSKEACAVQPTIVSGVSNASRIAQEEIFGPVVTVLECGSIEEAVNMANDTKYGLAGAVFSDDINEVYYVMNNMQAGLIHVNSYGDDDNMAPFGGYKESGIGKDKSVIAFDEYSQQKTVWMKFNK